MNVMNINFICIIKTRAKAKSAPFWKISDGWLTLQSVKYFCKIFPVKQFLPHGLEVIISCLKCEQICESSSLLINISNQKNDNSLLANA